MSTATAEPTTDEPEYDSNLYIRPIGDMTIDGLLEKLESPGERLVVNSDEIEFDLVDEDGAVKQDGVIRLTGHDLTLPADRSAMRAFAGWAEVPEAFLLRIPVSLRQTILNTLVPKQGQAHVLVGKHDTGVEGQDPIDVLREVQNPESKLVDPRRLIEVASRVIDPAANVVDFWSDAVDFRLDVIAPQGFDRGIGGDRQVGDLTRGGIRMGQDRKHALAPWVQPFVMRLACTNGMEMRDDDLKIDARGATLEDVMGEFAEMCEMAFSQVERRIEHFYDLRDTKLDKPERAVLRMAQEQGLPERTIMQLLERVPAVMPGEEANLFDVVNLITNHANAPGTKDGVVRKLQVAGGAIVTEHASRCGTCLSKLN